MISGLLVKHIGLSEKDKIKFIYPFHYCSITFQYKDNKDKWVAI